MTGPDHSVPFVTACPVGCTSAWKDSDIALPEGLLRRCSECGQLVSRASKDRYWTTMAQFDAPDFNQPLGPALDRRNRVANRRLARIATLLGRPPSGTRILDVGCSRGQFVAACERAGFEAEGVEPAPHIAAAAQNTGLNVHQGLLEELSLPAAAYHAITLFEVIEHLQSPLPLLRECLRILKPRGILVLSTGNAASWTAAAMRARWDYFHIAKDGGHISFFNPRSIALMAERAGYQVEAVVTARVKFHERADTTPVRYAAGKLLAELLNWPARVAGRGHDMLAYLRKP